MIFLEFIEIFTFFLHKEQRSLEKSLENLERIESEWRKFKEFSKNACFPNKFRESLAEKRGSRQEKVFSNRIITENSEVKRANTRFFTPKSSPKIANQLEPILL